MPDPVGGFGCIGLFNPHKQLYEEGAIIASTLHIGKVRHHEVQ